MTLTQYVQYVLVLKEDILKDKWGGSLAHKNSPLCNLAVGELLSDLPASPLTPMSQNLLFFLQPKDF